MVAIHEIRAGARVSGSRGERLGVGDAITNDEASGEPSAFVVKSGFWPLTSRKILSVDTIRQVNRGRRVSGLREAVCGSRAARSSFSKP